MKDWDYVNIQNYIDNFKYRLTIELVEMVVEDIEYNLYEDSAEYFINEKVNNFVKDIDFPNEIMENIVSQLIEDIIKNIMEDIIKLKKDSED